MEKGKGGYKNGQGRPVRGEVFNTLAQNGTDNGRKSAIILIGNGSDLTNRKAIKGRAKRKLITQKMALGLVDIANKKGDTRRKKSYWNTYHCQNLIYTANGKMYGRYCKNRVCTLCCSIRKADIINRYFPIIQHWPQPYFVTLTVKSVSASKLYCVMRSMVYGFKKITSKYRKKNLRGKGIKLKGIRSLECNFNPKKRTYNPHFHVIVPNLEIANILVKEWLHCSKKGWTGPKAQKKSKIYNNQTALIELIKYGSKIFTEPDVCNKVKTKGQIKIYLAALDVIFFAMKGLRIFERFGFDLPKRNGDKKDNATVVQEYSEWVFEAKNFDWINTKTEQTLSENNPSGWLLHLLENDIDITVE